MFIDLVRQEQNWNLRALNAFLCDTTKTQKHKG